MDEPVVVGVEDVEAERWALVRTGLGLADGIQVELPVPAGIQVLPDRTVMELPSKATPAAAMSSQM
ncbi:hypothetical protein AB0B31_25650 [Catellatospora citrea]|uniref:hypothetical protein n=1 Tax=Catellatospora citrea TaxID=53366 RepID=UPI0033DB4141